MMGRNFGSMIGFERRLVLSPFFMKDIGGKGVYFSFFSKLGLDIRQSDVCRCLGYLPYKNVTLCEFIYSSLAIPLPIVN